MSKRKEVVDTAVLKEQPLGLKLSLHSAGSYPSHQRYSVVTRRADPCILIGRRDYISNAETGECLHALKGEVTCIAFDPVGGVIAGGGADTSVTLWNVASGSVLRTLKGHKRRSKIFHGQTTAAGLLHVRGRQNSIWDTLSWSKPRLISFHVTFRSLSPGPRFATDCHCLIQPIYIGSCYRRTNP